MKKLHWLFTSCVIALLFTFVGTDTTWAEAKYKIPNDHQISPFEKEVAKLVNQERKERGLKPLKLSSDVSYVARKKSEDMRDQNYYDHDSPTYGDAGKMMKDHGITVHYWGENIAVDYPTPEEMMEIWMHSDGHRENILNPNYTHLGVGHAPGASYDDYDHYWTQIFIKEE